MALADDMPREFANFVISSLDTEEYVGSSYACSRLLFSIGSSGVEDNGNFRPHRAELFVVFEIEIWQP